LTGCGANAVDSTTANMNSDTNTDNSKMGGNNNWNNNRNGSGNTDPSSGDATNTGAKKGSLPIPELIKPVTRNGVKHYDLNVNQAQHEFFDGILTKTFSISSTYLGPTLLLTNGDNVSLNYTNNLSEEITMHGHGMHVPAKMDGTPHQTIGIGETWSAQYTVNQKACTNWYHPHTHHKTPHHVYQGLAGMIIIEDDESKALDLPNRYGIDDIPVVLQDRFFSADKTTLDYTPSQQQINRGYIGDVFITNGAIEPTFDAEAKEIRFRLLNGSNSTVYDLSFSNGKSFKQIGGDNSLLKAPVKMTRLVLSPGERAEIVVDLTDDMGTSFTLHESRENKTFMTINVNKNATAITSLPDSLATLDDIDLSLVKRTRQFTLDMNNMQFTINRKAMDMNRIDEIVPLGDTEIWEVTNKMMMDHNFHMHATHFRVIERNGSAANVLENEKGYKDVVYLKGRESVKLLVKMTDYADETVPYMYHCHFLEHENNAMMGQFTVV
jgi:FtsP/CotA-like multicopper oxidase with cupredoxin domain